MKKLHMNEWMQGYNNGRKNLVWEVSKQLVLPPKSRGQAVGIFAKANGKSRSFTLPPPPHVPSSPPSRILARQFCFAETFSKYV